jgi:O-antigen/teichoic acid export membrane protein
VPTIVLAPIPFFSVVLSFQRSMLVIAQRTRPVTWATLIEVGGIVLLFPLLGWQLGLVGVTAAACALLAGRIAGNAYLLRACVRALHRVRRA